LTSTDSAEVELSLLISLFYQQPEHLGKFREVSIDDVPQACAQLLAHNHHMTVTVERFHGGAVDLKVLASKLEGERYWRKIVLTRQSDGHVVMFGIVRLNLGVLAPRVRTEVESMKTPLGRILIDNHVWRVVKLLNLYEIEPGEDLRRSMNLNRGQICFGRTALIYCDGAPAIELLEIVAGD
jgi:chorismate-pyruvate lyase